MKPEKRQEKKRKDGKAKEEEVRMIIYKRIRNVEKQGKEERKRQNSEGRSKINTRTERKQTHTCYVHDNTLSSLV